MPWHDLRQADVVAGLANPRLDLVRRLGRADEHPISPDVGRLLRQRH